MGHAVKCSIAISTYFFPNFDHGNGPAKSTENISNREFMYRSVVFYFDMETAF